jgi:hypothetical protein
MTRNPAPDSVDAFLWKGTEARAQSATPRGIADSEASREVVIDVAPIPAQEYLLPAGMFNQWPLDVLFQISKPFTGLVVLINLVRTHRRPTNDEGLLQLVTACLAGLLRENDFGCRTIDGEFVLVCPGQQGPEAQRRLSQISERLWEFQQRHGTSLLFSWGGVGTLEKPLSEAIAAAVNRMNHINRKRKTSSMESVKHYRKTV